jgi:hypothetical protein
MNDTHFKVASACLTSLNVLTELFPEKVSFSLENLIPKLLNNLIDTNEAVIE